MNMAGLGERGESHRSVWGRFGRAVRRYGESLRRGFAQRGEVDVFPWLEQTIAVAALIGAAGCLGLGVLFAVAPDVLILVASLGAILGALCGITLAVTWAVERSAAVAAADTEPVDLWDPWLD